MLIQPFSESPTEGSDFNPFGHYVQSEPRQCPFVNNGNHFHPIAYIHAKESDHAGTTSVMWIKFLDSVQSAMETIGAQYTLKDVQYVVSDNDKTIRKGVDKCRAISRDVRFVNCFFHLKKNIKAHKKEIIETAESTTDEADREYAVFVRDVDEVANLTFEGISEHLDALLHQNWESALPRAAQLLEGYSGRRLGNWKRAQVPPMVPLTNNALESFNRRVKEDGTDYKLHDISSAIGLLVQFAESKSKTSARLFKESLTITKRMWKAASVRTDA